MTRPSMSRDLEASAAYFSIFDMTQRATLTRFGLLGRADKQRRRDAARVVSARRAATAAGRASQPATAPPHKTCVASFRRAHIGHRLSKIGADFTPRDFGTPRPYSRKYKRRDAVKIDAPGHYTYMMVVLFVTIPAAS